MAKVGTEQIIHKGSGKYIFCQINFYSKSKLFQIIDFPKNIEDWYGSKLDRENTVTSSLNGGKIVAKSYEECVALGRKVYTEFYEQDIKEEKIICYQLKSNFPRPEFYGNNDHNEISFAPSLAIGLEYKVMYRITIGEESFISFDTYENSKQPETGVRFGGPSLYREDSSQGLYNYIKIPYTEQSHAFFQNVEKGLKDMILKVNDFFGDSPAVLLEKIESGRLLTK